MIASVTASGPRSILYTTELLPYLFARWLPSHADFGGPWTAPECSISLLPKVHFRAPKEGHTTGNLVLW